MDKESPEYFITIGMILGLILFVSILGSVGLDSPYTRLQESSPEQNIIFPTGDPYGPYHFISLVCNSSLSSGSISSFQWEKK